MKSRIYINVQIEEGIRSLGTSVSDDISRYIKVVNVPWIIYKHLMSIYESVCVYI